MEIKGFTYKGGIYMKKIFVAIDGSEHAWKALDYAAELAKGMHCSLFVYTALKPSDSGALLAMYDMDDPLLATEVAGLDDLGEKLLNQAKNRIDASIEAEFEYQVGYPPEMILAAAEKSGADTIVMGSRGLSGIKELLLGSVSNHVVHYAKVPVVIVK